MRSHCSNGSYGAVVKDSHQTSARLKTASTLQKLRHHLGRFATERSPTVSWNTEMAAVQTVSFYIFQDGAQSNHSSRSGMIFKPLFYTVVVPRWLQQPWWRPLGMGRGQRERPLISPKRNDACSSEGRPVNPTCCEQRLLADTTQPIMHSDRPSTGYIQWKIVCY